MSPPLLLLPNMPWKIIQSNAAISGCDVVADTKKAGTGLKPGPYIPGF